MAITAQMVKELREKTGVGMMDCKTALQETNGDMEAAVDWLRTKGLAKAAKKAGRVAAEGLIGVADGGNRAAMVELNSETDFVSRNEQFQNLVRSVAAGRAEDRRQPRQGARGGDFRRQHCRECRHRRGRDDRREHDAAPRRRCSPSMRASWRATSMRRSRRASARSACWSALRSAGDAQKLTALGRQVAMHVAAANPLAVDVDRLDPETVARERAVFAEQARDSGKPENIIEKMVEGRLRKFYEEAVLLKQVFVIDGERTVETVLKDAAKDVGGPVTLVDFVAFRLGEGIQRSDESAG